MASDSPGIKTMEQSLLKNEGNGFLLKILYLVLLSIEWVSEIAFFNTLKNIPLMNHYLSGTYWRMYFIKMRCSPMKEDVLQGKRTFNQGARQMAFPRWRRS